jgi:S1-C subfamily serine protease
VLKGGQPARGFLGIAGQTVQLPDNRRGGTAQEQGLLIVGVTPGSPADAAGVLIGDVLLQFDGRAIQSAEDLLDLLVGDRVGRAVPATLLRGGALLEITLTVGTRQAS